MTLTEFITGVCKEVFQECSPTPRPYSSGKKRRLITEEALRAMIRDGSADSIEVSDLMTPLAKDLWRKHNQENIKR